MVRISVIIPTYNEEKYIGRTLRSIRNQRYRDMEVIIADGNSSDRTVEIAKRIYKDVQICTDKRRGVARACNKAAKMAVGDILLFIDADTSISDTMLHAYDRAFRRDIVAATGPIRPLEHTTRAMAIAFQIISVHMVTLLIKVRNPSIIASNMAVSRKAFQRIGGFDEKLVTYQDWNLSHRLGKIGKVAFVKDAVAYTSVRRVKKWGVAKYFAYHTSNAILYHTRHRAREDYEPIR